MKSVPKQTLEKAASFAESMKRKQILRIVKDEDNRVNMEKTTMKIGILCASDDELAPFLPIINHDKTTEKAMLRFHEGQINGIEVVALFSGVCKVNAAIAAQILIDTFSVNIIINSGTAGGMHFELEVFDTVISTESCYHDVAEDLLTEFHPWMKSIFFEADKELIALSKIAASKVKSPGRLFWGRMATGEAFITDEGRKKINDTLAPLTVDMETAGIAHVCYVNHIPFISIRCITDNAAHRGITYFEENCVKASIIAKNIAVAIINELSLS